MGFPPPLESVLGLLIAIPAGMAIVSGAKDGLTKGICYALVALGLMLFLAAPVEPIEDLLRSSRIITRLFGIAVGILGVMAGVRIPNRIIATLLVTAGVLVAARTNDLLGGWSSI